MFRKTIHRFVGVEGEIFMSVVKDKRYLDHRLSLLGKENSEGLRPAPLSEEELKRFTTSIGSKENLFNYRAGSEPSTVVNEETGVPDGCTSPNPTRFGDWESNGRCHDF